MALLDADRFEGRFRDGVHVTDTSDLMRRLVKEELVKFDGTPLFPERLAYTVNYQLSDAEADLYKQVTDYVRQEFNRADALENEGRRGTVGFALTILQRRLASSPEAIYQSLRRRRERLEARLRETKLLKRGAEVHLESGLLPPVSSEDIEDLEDAPDAEVEALEEDVLDQATGLCQPWANYPGFVPACEIDPLATTTARWCFVDLDDPRIGGGWMGGEGLELTVLLHGEHPIGLRVRALHAGWSDRHTGNREGRRCSDARRADERCFPPARVPL